MGREDERLMILELLEKGKITAEEAEKIIACLTPAEKAATVETQNFTMENSGKERRAHWMRIRVTEISTGKRKLSLLLPIFFLRFGISFTERRVKTEKERKGLQMGKAFFRNAVVGKVVDASDPEDDERVEITFL